MSLFQLGGQFMKSLALGSDPKSFALVLALNLQALALRAPASTLSLAHA